MRRTMICALAAAFVLLPACVGAADDDFIPGLAAHYYRDSDFWGDNWPDDVNVPPVSAADWTFSHYAYTRVEPLINYLFIRSGWFSVRWLGYLDTAVAGVPDREAEYTFRLWADDGCRLYIEGQELISDWRACCEKAPSSWRQATVTLSPGKHKISVEYFQGQSLVEGDRDPVKLFWRCPTRGIPLQIVPDTNLFFTEDDLKAPAGRLD